MKFEYDSNKSYTNEQKHGINFEDAQLLWQDENLLEVSLIKRDRLLLIKMFCYTLMYLRKGGYVQKSSLSLFIEEVFSDASTLFCKSASKSLLFTEPSLFLSSSENS